MTTEEQNKIDAWFDATQKAQPSNTLAFLVYVRDGNVILGRGSVAIEMRDFDLHNLPQVQELVSGAIANVYEHGIDDGADDA